MSGKLNITIEQGASYQKQVTVKEKVSGTPVDLTGATISGQVKALKSDVTPLATFAFDITNASGGVFQWTLSAVVTAALDFDTGFYDVEILFPTTEVDRLLEGRVTLTQEVTV